MNVKDAILQNKCPICKSKLSPNAFLLGQRLYVHCSNCHFVFKWRTIDKVKREEIVKMDNITIQQIIRIDPFDQPIDYWMRD